MKRLHPTSLFVVLYFIWKRRGGWFAAAAWGLSLWIVTLQTAPEQFPAEEFPISESKVNMDVNFPGAAFVIVSCKESQSGFRKE